MCLVADFKVRPATGSSHPEIDLGYMVQTEYHKDVEMRSSEKSIAAYIVGQTLSHTLTLSRPSFIVIITLQASLGIREIYNHVCATLQLQCRLL
jgi:hypothetical protein